MITCPKCKLGSPDDALRCDCGYDFQSKKIEKSYNAPRNGDEKGIPIEQLPAAKKQARLWLGLSIVIIFTHIICQSVYSIGIISFATLVPGFIFCCSKYAMSKGYDWTWGFIGIFSVVGLLILANKHYKIRGQ